MTDCIFCKIVSKEIPGEIVYEDDSVMAFHDINPEAPVHMIVIPKEHIPSIAHITKDHQELLGHIHLVMKDIAKRFDLEKDGYRIVNNCGELGGQTVQHVHFHLLGGRQMQWPPG